MTDDEEDGADAVAGGNGAAGDDGERGCVRGDGDEAEVGGTGGEFGGALSWGVGGEGVSGGEIGAVGLVIEGPHERGRIEKVDGGDAERDHRPV